MGVNLFNINYEIYYLFGYLELLKQLFTVKSKDLKLVYSWCFCSCVQYNPTNVCITNLKHLIKTNLFKHFAKDIVSLVVGAKPLLCVMPSRTDSFRCIEFCQSFDEHALAGRPCVGEVPLLSWGIQRCWHATWSSHHLM